MTDAQARAKTPAQRVLLLASILFAPVLIVGMWQDFTYEVQPEWTRIIPSGICLLIGAQNLINPAPHLTAQTARWVGIVMTFLGAASAILFIFF